MSKKILSVVLALVFVLSTFAVSAFAINGSYAEDKDATYTQTWALDAKDNGDGTWTVAVKLTTDYEVGAIQFKVLNSNSKVTLDKEASEIGAGIPENYGAQFQCSETGKVLIVPEPELGAPAVKLTDAVVAELVYNVPAGESATLTIDGNDAKTADKPEGTLVALRMADKYLESGDMVYGQIVTKDAKGIAATAQLGSASAPELAVIDGTIGVINTDYTEYGADFASCTGYIYGVEPENGESVDSVFEVIGDGEMEIIANEAGSEAGTGTIVNVLDLDGNVVASYVLIIFGDIDGDGQITALDSTDAKLHDAWGYGDNLRIEAPEVLFAGDVDVDGDITALDGTDMQLHDAWGYGDNLRMYQTDVMNILQ